MGKIIYMESYEEYAARMGQQPQGPKIDKGYVLCLIPAIIGILLMLAIKIFE